MKVALYKYVLAAVTIFLYLVSTRLYKEVTTINEDTINSVFSELDVDHNGVLGKKEQSFLRYCAKNVTLQEVFGLANSKLIALKQFQLGIRPFSNAQINSVQNAGGYCRGLLQALTDPYEIDKVEVKKRKEVFKEIYDLNRNGKVDWKEFMLVNKLFGTDLGESVTVFIGKDGNTDFVLTKEEL